MPGIDQVTIIRRCSVCANEIETMTVKKDNMMLSSRAPVWCPSLRPRPAGAARHRRPGGHHPAGTGILPALTRRGAVRRAAGTLTCLIDLKKPNRPRR